MAMDKYVLYAVDVNGTVIDGVTQQGINPGIQETMNYGDGSPHPRFIGSMASKPVFSFSSKACAKVLGATTALGAAISANVTAFFYKTSEGGMRAGATSHVKLVIAAGMVVPRRISVSQDGEAEISCEVFCISSDGTTTPVAITTGQSLAGTPDSAEKFTLGPLTINGTTYQPVSMEIDFGLQVEPDSHSGFPYPVRVHVKQTAPKITFRTKDVGVIGTFGMAGLAQNATDSVFYLWKMSEGSQRTAKGSGAHISFTIDEAMYVVNQASGSGNEDAEMEVIAHVSYDGTNNPFVVATNATIPV